MVVADHLTVVTLNTWNGQGDFAKRQRAIIDGLAALDPDVVFLQEVFAAPALKANLALACAAALNRHYVHHPARVKRRAIGGVEVVSTSGLCLLARRPPLAPRVVVLPTNAADGERLAQIAYIDWEGRAIALVNVHLSHLDDRDDLRILQLETVVDALVTGRPFDAAIVAGDFNAAPGSAVVSWLKEHPAFAVADAYGILNRPFATLVGQDADADRHACIDHVFVLSPAPVPALSFVAVDRVLEPGTGPRGAASDHYGVRAGIRVNGGA